jgi:enoyl-CoA hydratase
VTQVPLIGDRISLARDGHVLVATIAHPTHPMNVVDQQMHHQLRILMAALKAESSARAIVLQATGKAFCAGGDFDWFPALRSVAAQAELHLEAKGIIYDLLDVRAPIVCALNGHAMGLGASIALMCDSIVMAEGARIGDPHVNVGLVAGDGGAAIWPLVVGPTLAKRYLMTGDALSAQQCAAMGLVTDLCGSGEANSQAMALARRLAAQPPLAVQHTKAAVNLHLKAALVHSFEVSIQAEMMTFFSADHVEAVNAAQQRRPGTYEGH